MSDLVTPATASLSDFLRRDPDSPQPVYRFCVLLVPSLSPFLDPKGEAFCDTLMLATWAVHDLAQRDVYRRSGATQLQRR